MVFFSDLGFIDKLLSTSSDRALYEALWLVAITTNHRVDSSKYDFNKVKISDICNNLIAQWNKRDQRRKNFYLSTQLFIGTVYVYQFQVQNLYDQAQTALRSCRLAFFDVNWIMSQVPMSQNQSTPTNESQKKKGKTAGKSKKKIESKTQDDYDIIEEFFKVVDDVQEVEAVVKPQKKTEGKKMVQDSGFDPTMASNLGAITMLDPATMMTSGFNTMNMELEDEHMLDFGTDDADFQHLIMDTEPSKQNGNAMCFVDQLSFGGGEIDSCLRDAPASTHQCEIADIEMNDPEGPTTVDGEQCHRDLILPEPVEIEMPPTNNELPENQSELALPEIKNAVGKIPSKPKKNRKLIIDKVTKIDLKALKESSDYYAKKIQLKPPRDTWDKRLEEMKKNVETLFPMPSRRLQQSATLRALFDRNLKKIPESLYKKRLHSNNGSTNDEPGKENDGKKRREALRKRDNTLKDLNEDHLLNQAFEMPEIEYTPQLQPEIPIDYAPSPSKATSPVAQKSINDQDQSQSSRNVPGDNIKLSKKDIMQRLKQFWKKKDDAITMTKLCAGLSRISAAGVFFELLALSKANHIELMQNEGSLEIANISCKLSATQISKLYK